MRQVHLDRLRALPGLSSAGALWVEMVYATTALWDACRSLYCVSDGEGL